MSKTQIGGNRIRLKSITFEHLADGIKIPESLLNLLYSTHPHLNKDVIDKIRYTGVQPTVDLRDFELVMLEVIGARQAGLNLGGTIDAKADKAEVIRIAKEIADATGTASSLDEAIKQYGQFLDNKLTAHIGAIGHEELDRMYSDYINAKAGNSSLTERLNNLPTDGGGGGGTGGTANVNVLNPWRYNYTIKNNNVDPELNKVITFPHTYTPNANCIEVFENALRMESGADKDYVEVDEHTIKFNYPLPTGTVVNITGIGGGVTLYIWKEIFKTTEGQRNFVCLDRFNVNKDEIVVYESGLLMTKGTDYEELDEHTVQFKYPLPANTSVIIYRRR